MTLLSALPLVRLHPLGLALEIDPSNEPLLPLHDPAQASYGRAVRDFGDDEVYVVAMETDAGVFQLDALERLRRVNDEIARLPEVRRVQSLADVVSFRWDAEQEWIEVGRFLEDVPERSRRARGAAPARARPPALPTHVGVGRRKHGGGQRHFRQDDGPPVHRVGPRRTDREDPRRRDGARACASTSPDART